MSYIANVVDNELDEHPQTVVVCGGDLNKLNIGRLEELTGRSAILDFTTRGLSYLVHCLSNRTNLLGKCWQNLITVVWFYRLAESFVPKFRSTIKESRDSVIYAWHWQRKTGEMFFGPRMLTKQLIKFGHVHAGADSWWMPVGTVSMSSSWPGLDDPEV